MTATFWTDERVEILKSRRAANWTARAIAALLGCTRNAVLGKASRLRLPPAFHSGGHPSTNSRRALAAVRRECRPMRVHSARLALPGGRRERAAAVADLPVIQDEPVSRRIALTELKAGECRWMSGNDGCCCGHATAQMFARGRHMASPYCGFHSARAYRLKKTA